MSPSISSAADILAGAPPATPLAPADEPAAPAGNLGLLAGAKAHRDQRIGKERLTLWVPGPWDGKLAIRFRPVVGEGQDRMERIAAAGNPRTTEEQRAVMADFLVEAVDRFMVPDAGKLVALEVNQRPATWAEIGQALDVDVSATGARGVMLNLFLTEEGDVNNRALVDFAAKVNQWVADTSAEVEGAIVGESSA